MVPEFIHLLGFVSSLLVSLFFFLFQFLLSQLKLQNHQLVPYLFPTKLPFASTLHAPALISNTSLNLAEMEHFFTRLQGDIYEKSHLLLDLHFILALFCFQLRPFLHDHLQLPDPL